MRRASHVAIPVALVVLLCFSGFASALNMTIKALHPRYYLKGWFQPELQPPAVGEPESQIVQATYHVTTSRISRTLDSQITFNHAYLQSFPPRVTEFDQTLDGIVYVAVMVKSAYRYSNFRLAVADLRNHTFYGNHTTWANISVSYHGEEFVARDGIVFIGVDEGVQVFDCRGDYKIAPEDLGIIPYSSRDGKNMITWDQSAERNPNEVLWVVQTKGIFRGVRPKADNVTDLEVLWTLDPTNYGLTEVLYSSDKCSLAGKYLTCSNYLYMTTFDISTNPPKIYARTEFTLGQQPIYIRSEGNRVYAVVEDAEEQRPAIQLFELKNKNISPIGEKVHFNPLGFLDDVPLTFSVRSGFIFMNKWNAIFNARSSYHINLAFCDDHGVEVKGKKCPITRTAQGFQFVVPPCSDTLVCDVPTSAVSNKFSLILGFLAMLFAWNFMDR